MCFLTGVCNSRGDDQEQSVDISHFNEHKHSLKPSSGIDITEGSREEDKVLNDR